MGRFVTYHYFSRVNAESHTTIAVFSALRVHALSQKNWFLTAFTFFWSVLAFPIDYYVSDYPSRPIILHSLTPPHQGDFHHRSYTHDSVLGCTSEATTPTFLSLLCVGVSSSVEALADSNHSGRYCHPLTEVLLIWSSIRTQAPSSSVGV